MTGVRRLRCLEMTRVVFASVSAEKRCDLLQKRNETNDDDDDDDDDEREKNVRN